MAELKTKPTKASVTGFLAAVEDEGRRKDCRELLRLMRSVTARQPKMWGASIVGFGTYHYRYASGREGDFFVTGFSPRKTNLTIYVMPGFSRYPSLMKRLGKYRAGKSCLYVKRLDDVDREVLRTLIERSVADMHRLYECR